MERLFTAAFWIAWAAWLGVGWMIWRGPGVMAFFGTDRHDLGNPAALLVLGLLGIVLWLLLRRVRRGVLSGRATLWSSISGLAFAVMGAALALTADWAVWAPPFVLGLALFTLALEPFVRGEE